MHEAETEDSGNGRLSAVFAAWVCVSMAQLANGRRGQWHTTTIRTMKTMRMGGRWSEGIDTVRSGQIERSWQTGQVRWVAADSELLVPMKMNRMMMGSSNVIVIMLISDLR